MDLLDADWACIASVDDALVILDGKELSSIVKNGPVFLDQSIDLVLDARVEVRQIEVLVQGCAMSCLDVCSKKIRIDLIERWGGVLAFLQDCATIDIMENHVKFMQLIRVTTVIVKNVSTFPATYPGSYSNQFGA